MPLLIAFVALHYFLLFSILGLLPLPTTKTLALCSSMFLFPLTKIQRTNRLRILLILPFPLSKIFQRTNHLRYLLFPLTKIQRTNRLRILCPNTLEGTSFVAQVEGTSTWVFILRTREGTSLVDQFK